VSTIEIYRVSIDPFAHDRGELVHSMGSVWANAR
jgi:hypothetical protein